MSDDGELPDGIDHNTVYYAITSGINSDQVKLAQTLNDTISLAPVSVNSKGGILSIESRVSDKGSGDIGHPVQYDYSIGQWYVNVSTTTNEIYDSVVGLGTSTLGSASPRTFISRKPDARSLDDRIYKVRYVVPKDSTVLSKPPSDSFVIQESSSTVGVTDAEVLKYNSIDPVQISNTSELRNPRIYPLVANYIKELRQEVQEKYGISFEKHISELAQIRNQALEKGAWSAAVNAEVARGKAGGLYVDQKLVMTGNVDNMSAEEIRDRLKKTAPKNHNLKNCGL